MRLVCKHGLIFSAICSQIWPIGELHMNMVIGWNKYRVGVCLEKKLPCQNFCMNIGITIHIITYIIRKLCHNRGLRILKSILNSKYNHLAWDNLFPSSLGTNIKKPNFEHLEHWKIEHRTSRTFGSWNRTELEHLKPNIELL